MMLAHGQIKPGAMQSVDRGRESFLFPASLIGEVTRLAGAGQLPLPPESQKPI